MSCLGDGLTVGIYPLLIGLFAGAVIRRMIAPWIEY